MVLTKRNLLAAGLAVVSTRSMAQAWPTKPIRMIVPLAPGATADIVARVFAEELGKSLGQTVVVDNKTGAGGTIATAELARAPADGYTMGLVSQGTMVFNIGLYKTPGYDPLKDFVPVALVRAAPLMLVVHPSTPVQHLKDFVAWAKARPGKLTYGSAGTGSGQHLAGAQFHKAAGLDIIHVPYKGGGQALTDMLGAQISLMYLTQSVANPHVAGNRLRPLAISSAKRSRFNPDVVTFAEAGYPGVNAVTINGMVAPAGMPRDVVQRLNALVARVLKSRELEKKLPDLEFDGEVLSPEQFGAWIRAEIDKWGKVIKTSGIKVE